MGLRSVKGPDAGVATSGGACGSTPIKVLQVSGYESPGMRFNGVTLAPLLRRHGVVSTHKIWERDTGDPAVRSFSAPHSREVAAMHARLEERFSLQSLLYGNARQIWEDPAFGEADLLHLHLLHTGYLSLSDLPRLTARKPTVWTLHDPWAFTGHCVYPFDCHRWRVGCGRCPDLSIHFPMREDRTAMMFDYKRHTYGRSRFSVIVASRWMRDMARMSPLFEGVPVYEVPFGLDLRFFAEADGRAFRTRHAIPGDSVVIAFRAQHNFKGLDSIVEALERVTSPTPICLVTVANKGLVDRFADRFQLVELGWVNDQAELRDALAASDMFLMPSVVEAFGVMAIEAMACGKPVICFAGTSLPEVTHAPDVGIAVPMRDARALGEVIQRLIDRPEERRRRGLDGRALAERLYGDERQAREIAAVYRDVLASSQGPPGRAAGGGGRDRTVASA